MRLSTLPAVLATVLVFGATTLAFDDLVIRDIDYDYDINCMPGMSSMMLRLRPASLISEPPLLPLRLSADLVALPPQVGLLKTFTIMSGDAKVNRCIRRRSSTKTMSMGIMPRPITSRRRQRGLLLRRH